MSRTRSWLTVAALLALTAVAYQPLWGNGFVNYDDDLYITDNPNVTDGLTARGFAWAWTTLHGNYWQPLSWLSLQVDAQFFPTSPVGRPQPSAAIVHGLSLCWHAASTLLLFALLRQWTGAWGRSFLVAALFAVHPMHVESVAWAAERKDVLSVFFGLATLWAYARYAAAPGAGRYALLVTAYALCLLAKPMLMTLPFVLLLLDYWPLGRLKSEIPNSKSETNPQLETQNSKPRGVRSLGFGFLNSFRISGLGFRIWEKVPLFLLAAVIAVVTVIARARTGSAISLAALPLSARLANAVSAYGWYLAQTAWPRGLTVLYPHPEERWTILPVLAGGVVLLGGTLVSLWQRRRRPWLIVGWLWFVVSLLPVIGLAQGGLQARADRFTYWPHIGLFVIAAWGLAELAGRLRVPAAVAKVTAALLLAVLVALTRMQVGYWRDPETLWEHALAVTDDNFVAHQHLTSYYVEIGRPDRAAEEAAEAVRIRPESHELQYSLGVVLLNLGRNDEAARALLDAVRRAPGSASAWHNLGVARLRQGRPEQAARSLSQALTLEPGSVDTLASLGLALWRSGQREEGLRALQSALELDPCSADAWNGLGAAHLTQGRTEQASEALARALRLRPGMVGAYSNMGLALGRAGQWAGAAGCHRRAVAMEEAGEARMRAVNGRVPAPESIPQIVIYRCRLAFALDHLGDRSAADAVYREALRRDPEWPSEFRARARQLSDDPNEGRRDPLLAAEMTAQAAAAERLRKD